MALLFKTIDLGTISAGGSKSDTWEVDANYTLKHIIAVEKSGATLTNVVGTFWIDNATFTKEVVPLSVFQGYVNQVPVFDLPLKDGQKFKYSVENRGTTDVNVFIVLVLEGELSPSSPST